MGHSGLFEEYSLRAMNYCKTKLACMYIGATMDHHYIKVQL